MYKVLVKFTKEKTALNSMCVSTYKMIVILT